MAWLDSPPPSWGELTVRFVKAEYDEEYLTEPPNSFCSLWLLEKVKWRRRKSRPRGAGVGEEPLRPQWGEEFTFEDVRDDSKLAVDVWSVRKDSAEPDEFFGKVTIVLSEALAKPVPAWHELLPGRIQLELTWVPQGGRDGPTAEPVALTQPAPAEGRSTPSALPTGAPPRPMTSEPVARMAPPSAAQATIPASEKMRHQGAMAALEAVAQEYEEEDFEEDEDDDMAAAPPAPPAAPAEFFEFTHRGGSGHGGKENQDAYFLHRIDERNVLFGVLDGHGHDHGRIASWAASDACRDFLKANFDRLRSEPQLVMKQCFKAAHDAVYRAIKAQPEVWEKDGLLVQDVDEEDWPLGYDAADGGTTASVGALIDGHILVYAAAGDSCSVLGVPQPSSGPRVEELIPEHSPTNLNDWVERLQHTGVHVVFDTPDMFDDQPNNLLPIFSKDGRGGWEIKKETMATANELGCGLKTERGDLASVVMTPENGRYSQMMLGVTRTVGDFYHQTYGVTWEPEVVVKDLTKECAEAGSTSAVLIVASDGVWDHWTFEDSVKEILLPNGGLRGQPITSKKLVLDFFEKTRLKGEQEFGDGADNLTGIVALLPSQPPA